MKEELIKYIMEKADECYSDDFPINNIEIWIRDFFNQYGMKNEEKIDDIYPSFFPPPWNIYQHVEKTTGWIEAQKAQRRGDFELFKKDEDLK